jgi:hypothetical protein
LVATQQRRSCCAGVALGEDQVQDPKGGVQAIVHLAGTGESEREVAASDRLLGPGDPAGHRLIGAEQRSGDLSAAQAPDRSERQRELRGHRQRGMAAQQQQHERVIDVSGLPLVRAG